METKKTKTENFPNKEHEEITDEYTTLKREFKASPRELKASPHESINIIWIVIVIIMIGIIFLTYKLF